VAPSQPFQQSRNVRDARGGSRHSIHDLWGNGRNLPFVPSESCDVAECLLRVSQQKRRQPVAVGEPYRRTQPRCQAVRGGDVETRGSHEDGEGKDEEDEGRRRKRC
jgi:hypothetical protein